MPVVAALFDVALKYAQRTAVSGNQVARYLASEVGSRMADRLDDIKRASYENVCLFGNNSLQILATADKEKFKNIYLISDQQPAFQQPASAAGSLSVVERPQLAGQKYEAILSSLCLHWTNDLLCQFKEIEQALASDGLFMASIIGGNSLHELRTCLQLAEMERCGGVTPHTSPMIGVADLGAVMQQAGFKLITGRLF